jgi:hypothetical protein
MSVLTNSINANSTTPLSSTQGGLGVSAPTAHGILVAEGASAVTPIVLTAGQVLIGTTASDPAGATLTAGTGISISSTSGSITITNTEPAGFTWTSETANTPLVKTNGYFAASASQLTFTLPVSAAVGDSFQVVASAAGTGGWLIAQNAGQQIQLGNEATTSGAGGSIASASTVGDWIYLVCSIANTNFVAYMAQGQATVT